MYQIDFKNKNQCFHFIGIGGISMSGLAELLLSKGFKVSGSDSKESSLTKQLEGLGAKISIGQKKENITDDIDIVVMTAAIRQDNPELMAAMSLNKIVLTRAELLGQIMTLYQIPAAIAGTHGKTTTTSMVSEMLLAAGADPTLSIGGILPSIGGNFRVGGSKHFVTEACEYTNSFLSFHPFVEIILNIDADHLDFFKDLDDIRNSFKRFASLLPREGYLIINGDIDQVQEITESTGGSVITFGLSSSCNYSATDITYDEYARPTYTLVENGKPTGQYTLGVTGIHNVLNSLSVIAYGRLFDIPDETIRTSLKAFTGTNRRFQLKGTWNGVTIIDDYAHHPTEIEATLKAAGNYPHKTLWCVFQPHTFTRTKALLDEFAVSLSLSDKVILPDIYPARETDDLGISSETLANKMKSNGYDNVWYIPEFSQVENFLEKNCIPGDVLITMGAGDVVNIGEHLLEK